MNTRVTLVAVDGTADPGATAHSLEVAAKACIFAKVLFIAPHPFSQIVIPRLDKNGYNRFCLRQLYRNIDTTHALTVQADSGIHNPAAWDPAWLEYDYIGAPWPPGHGRQRERVGNSGFCLRSRRLLEATSRIVKDDTCIWNGQRTNVVADDVVTCVMYRKELVKLGMKFAPVAVAAKFAFEQSTPEAKLLDRQFGYHRNKL